MKGFECKKCGTELHYEQVQGMRVKKIKIDKETGKEVLYYPTYCPTCKEYFEMDK